MKSVTIQLPELTLERLRAEARAAGRSLAEIVRERLERPQSERVSVYAQTSDLAGSLAGSRRAATKKRFRRM